MKNVLLRTLVGARVRAGGWIDRSARDRGQTAVEYLGIIVVVVAIVVAITGTDIGTTILTAIKNKIAKLAG
ncbi:Flp family type IVb pilin [Streptomyces sp. NPDC020807]|uniref:Flp family type IVb pilin n=1 Tax=Streptomyces sp. NPDC020807 TaxID=3155119 RepID=UPI0033BFF8F5